MKYIKKIGLLLVIKSSFASDSITFTDIESYLAPHIELIKQNSEKIEQEINKIREEIKNKNSQQIKEEKEKTGYIDEFDSIGDYFTKKETKENQKKKAERYKAKYFNKEKENTFKKKSEELKNKYKKDKEESIEKLKTELATIHEKETDLTEKDIKKIASILPIAKKISQQIMNLNSLKTFSDIDAFTKNYRKIISYIKDKEINSILLKAFAWATKKENEQNNSSLTTEMQNLFDYKKDKKDLTPTAHKIWNYENDLKKIIDSDREKFEDFILKNNINISAFLKKTEDGKNIVKKDFNNKTLNSMTIQAALSTEEKKRIIETESPAILRLIEKFKSTEEENKKTTIRKAVNIIIEFYETMTEKAQTIEKTGIKKQKEQARSENFNNKKTERIEKLEAEKKKLEAEYKNNAYTEKDKRILEKEINVIENNIKKIKKEEYKEQTYIDEKTIEDKKDRMELTENKIAEKGKNKKIAAEDNSKEKQKEVKKSIWEKTKEERLPVIKSRGSVNALKKAKEEGKKSKITEPNFNIIDENDKKLREKAKLEKINQNYYDFDNKETSKTDTESEFGISKKELESAKKGSPKEV